MQDQENGQLDGERRVQRVLVIDDADLGGPPSGGRL
jgi:hypothetical protein